MIVDDEEFHRDDFTVVLQPFMENIEAPKKVMAHCRKFASCHNYTSIAIRLQRSVFFYTCHICRMAKLICPTLQLTASISEPKDIVLQLLLSGTIWSVHVG